MKRETLYEGAIRRIRNNMGIFPLVVLVLICIGIAQITDAVDQTPAKIDVTGKWKTKVLTDPWFADTSYVLLFEFKARDGRLIGVVSESEPGRRPKRKAILDGRIQGEFISFYTAESLWTVKSMVPNKPNVRELVTYKHFYDGAVLGDRIEFMKYSDRPDLEPWEFEAIRE